jgi:hypothetical protein
LEDENLMFRSFRRSLPVVRDEAKIFDPPMRPLRTF